MIEVIYFILAAAAGWFANELWSRRRLLKLLQKIQKGQNNG